MLYFAYNSLREDEEDIMMTFHLRPDSNVFNRVIMIDSKLYVEDRDSSDSEEDFVEYEGEDWRQRNFRIKRRKSEKEKRGEVSRVKFCHPLRLSWAYAAVKQYPWLMDNCEAPLFIERAFKFNDQTYFQLVQMVAGGPNRFIKQQVSDKESCYYQSQCDAAYKRYCDNCESFVEMTLLRFGASGDEWYIDKIKESLNAIYADLHLNDRTKIQNTYYQFLGRYFDMEPLKPNESAKKIVEKINYSPHADNNGDLVDDELAYL